MKYIDAEKLIAEITRLKGQLIRGACASQIVMETNCKDEAYDEVLAFITSLQQEQPEGLHFTPLNRLIQKIPSENWNDTVNNYAKKLCDCLTKEGYLKDAAVLQGYISYMNGNNVPVATMDEQEQPEVDLEAEIRRYVEEIMGADPKSYFLENIALHFYELGLNARKEE